MKDYIFFIGIMLVLTGIVVTISLFIGRDVQEVCVPVHVHLNDSLYVTMKEDTIAVQNGLEVKRIYYTEKRKK